MVGWLQYIGESSYTPNVLDHEAYGPFWENQNNEPYWTDVTYPAVHTAGWYDSLTILKYYEK